MRTLSSKMAGSGVLRENQDDFDKFLSCKSDVSSGPISVKMLKTSPVFTTCFILDCDK